MEHRHIMASTAEFDDYSFKVVLIGNQSVGKTALVERFRDNRFSENIESTIGCDFCKRTFRLMNRIVHLNLWDTAGHERFRTITRGYYRDANAVVMVYSVADKDSFDDMSLWLQNVRSIAPENVKIFLVANKTDLENEREVSLQSGHDLAMNEGMTVIETSAKVGTNVETLFLSIAMRLEESEIAARRTNSVFVKSKETQQKRCC